MQLDLFHDERQRELPMLIPLPHAQFVVTASYEEVDGRIVRCLHCRGSEHQTLWRYAP